MKKTINILVLINLILLLSACTKEQPKEASIVYDDSINGKTPTVIQVHAEPIKNPLPVTYPTPMPPPVYAPPKHNTSRTDARIKLFHQTDRNKDNRVSAKEYLAYCIHRTHTRNDKFINHYIKTHDTNGDGKLTFAEADKKRFEEIDKNNDNFLTADEMSLDWRGIERIVHVTPPPSAEERLAERIKSIKKDIRFCDTDGDGRISLKEGMSDRCDSMTKEEFTKYDSDNDNYITVKDRLNPRRTNNPPQRTGGYADLDKEMRFVFALGHCDKNHNSNLDEKEMTSKECGFTKKDFIENDYDKDARYTHEDLDYKRYMRTFHKTNKNRDIGLSLEAFIGLGKVGKVPY